MAQATFPEGISDDIPPEKSSAEEVIDAILKPMNDFFAGMEKVREHAAAGRKVNLEH